MFAHMALVFTTSCLADSISLFRYYQSLAEKAMAQVQDEDLFVELDADSNSIAIIVKHIAGNMRSRWTDFLTTDGEKPTRDRDSEFEAPPRNRAELMTVWQNAWSVLYAALEPLSDADLSRTVAIRGEAHSVIQAIHRQLAHYAYHIGQIVYLARHFAASRTGQWTSLSVPRKASAEFNRQVQSGEASQR